MKKNPKFQTKRENGLCLSNQRNQSANQKQQQRKKKKLNDEIIICNTL